MSVKTGVAAISSEVLGDIQKEAETLIRNAENEAKETLKAVKHEADQKYREMLTQAKVKAEVERRKIASVTEVDMRNHLLQAKEDLVDVAFEKATVEFKSFVQSDQYHEYLLTLIEAVGKKIDRKDLVVQLNSRDAAWVTEEKLKPLAKKLHAELKLATSTEQFIGGCIIQTGDGKIIYDSTIDTRLEELKPMLRVEVAKILFGEV